MNLEDLHLNPTVETVRKYIGERIGPNPLCVETCSSQTYKTEPGNFKHCPTYNMVWYIAKPNDGKLFTFEESHPRVNICRDVLIDDLAYWDGKIGKVTEN